MLLILAGAPVVALFFGSFWTSSPGSPGELTLYHYWEAFTTSTPAPLLFLLLNSFMFGFISAGLSVLIGAILAYILARTDLPAKSFFENLALVARGIPPLVGILAWNLLLNPNIGLLNQLLKLAGISLTLNIYSFAGQVFVFALHAIPIVFLTGVHIFRLMDPSLEEQARVCSSSPLRNFFKISLPIYDTFSIVTIHSSLHYFDDRR